MQEVGQVGANPLMLANGKFEQVEYDFVFRNTSCGRKADFHYKFEAVPVAFTAWSFPVTVVAVTITADLDNDRTLPNNTIGSK